MTAVLIVIGVLVILVILYVVIVGNRFVRLRNESHQALSGIDIQLQRRADLIPNLVARGAGLRRARERDVRGRHATPARG